MEIKVLKGGLDPGNTARYKFISAEVTDTRLMGVVAMHICFEDTIIKDAPKFHQFYYYDYEELGLETLKLLHSDSAEEIRIASAENAAGLGAKMIFLTEEEACVLADWMIKDTIAKKQELPAEAKELKFIQEKAKLINADDAFTEALNRKLCVQLKSDYGVVNYFLMRCFGLDYSAAELISELDSETIRNLTGFGHCTFLRNKIESDGEGVGGHRYYRCESVVEVESEECHHIVLTKLEVKDRKVVSAVKLSDMKISVYETGLILSKPEFISVFDLDTPIDEEFISGLGKFTLGMTHNEHEAGTMFMNFKPNNDHAENKVFLLSDDLSNLYYLTSKGQIVIAASNINGIIEAETRLMLSRLAEYYKPNGRYSLPNSIIYDFAESGIDDFNAFLLQLD